MGWLDKLRGDVTGADLKNYRRGRAVPARVAQAHAAKPEESPFKAAKKAAGRKR